MLSIAMDPSNSLRVYVGTRGAGVFKTTDGGQSWQPARNDLTFYPIRSLLVAPQDPNTLYAGTDNDGVWKSVDGGNNWFKSSTGLDDTLIVFQIVIDPLHPSTLYVGLAGGPGLSVGDIYKSTDSGTSWAKTDGGMPRWDNSTYTNGIFSLAIDPTNPLLLYAGTNCYGAFESVDGGGTWTAINNGLSISGCTPSESINALAVDTHHSNRLAAIIGGGYYVFVNNQWQMISLSSFINGSIFTDFLYFNPTNPLVVYSAGETFSKSTDGGLNWTNYLGWGAQTYSGGVSEIAFSLSSPDTIYAATSPLFDYFGGVYKSADQGQTWALASQGITATEIQSIAIDPWNPKFIYAGTGDGFFWGTQDGGGTWSRGYYVSDHIDYDFDEVRDIAVDPLNSQTVYLASDNSVYKSVDQGQSFNELTSDFIPKCMALSPGASSAIYIGTTIPGGVFKSSDGGVTWVQKNQGLPLFYGDLDPVVSLAIDPNQPQTVWAGTWYGGGIAQTVDGGDNWTVKGLTQENAVDAIAVRPDNSKIILAGTDTFGYNSLYKSNDGGASWQVKLSNIGIVYRIVFDPRDPDLVYAATEGTGVLLSSDGGETWNDYSDGLFYPLLYSLAISGDTPPTLVAGTYGSGLYWITPPSVYLLSASVSGSGTVAGTDGYINCPGTCNYSYVSDSQVTLNATPAQGWLFSGWSGACSGTGSCNVTMTQDLSVGATFTPIPVYYTLTVSTSGNGRVTSTDGYVNCPGTCSHSYLSNAQVPLNATPSQGWTFVGWNGACSGTGACVVALTQNLTVGATFMNGIAVYDSTLGAPECTSFGRSCDSGPSLLLGKDNMSGGAEANQPNTIHSSCADGTAGTFHVDESIDRLTIAKASGGVMRRGDIVRASATVWVADPTQDALDLYYSTDANNPVWIYIATLVPHASGPQTLSARFRLRLGQLQAVRANFRRGGTRASCTTGSFDDHDDLAFAVR